MWVVSVGVWMLLVAVSSSTASRRQTTWTSERGRSADDDGCVVPLKRVEMLDVNVDSTSYKLREIHVRHDVKVRADLQVSLHGDT